MNAQLKPIVLDDDIPIPDDIAPYIQCLAHEGVPVRAMARAFKRHVEPIRDCIRFAIARGDITQMPRDDWPPTSNPKDRAPNGDRPMPTGELSAILGHIYKLTSKEADILTVLVRKPGPQTKEAILNFVYGTGPGDVPEVKIVDVFICKVRKKLKKHGIAVATIWGQGYTLENDDRAIVTDRVNEYLALQKQVAA